MFLVVVITFAVLLNGFAPNPRLAAQSSLNTTTNSVNTSMFNGTLTLDIHNGIIVPKDCHFNRADLCNDFRKGIVYVPVRNGTANVTVQLIGPTHIPIKDGIAILPILPR
jgi:hypothetical protein